MTVVWTNGCFDVLHRGHIQLFEYARHMGDKLIVGIDSDVKVANDKGPSRPINTHIDEVKVFNSSAELEGFIKQINPDIMVIGSDWKEKKVVGAEFAKKVLFFDRIGNYSTTNILENYK